MNNPAQEYMKLSGQERFALMIMLDCESKPMSEAYNICIEHIKRSIKTKSRGHDVQNKT